MDKIQQEKCPSAKPLEHSVMLRTLAIMTEIFKHPAAGISYKGVHV